MSNVLRSVFAAFALAVGLSLGALAQAPKQQTFPTADAAADAIVDALRKNDDKATAAMLGAGWRDFVQGSPDEEDKQRADFLAAWDAELTVVQSLLAIVDAQRDYSALDPMKTGVATYARRLLSSPGKMDGLYWETRPGAPESPLGALVAKAQPGDREIDGYYGYHYRLLYGQGPAAKGGAYSYLVNGRMIGGFGVIAWPVRYGETGVMSFIVNQNGEVYEQDLGPETAQRAAAITLFDPDKNWQKADTTPP